MLTGLQNMINISTTSSMHDQQQQDEAPEID
jgi:hypothetical protein